MAFTFGNDKNILQETDILYVNAGAGDDKYILAPNKLSAGQTINITDTQGTNTIQLIGGLIFTKSLFALDALQLTLSNGAILNVLGAADFSYEIGGDPLSGKQGIVTDYSGFAMAFGSSVPATGINQSTGGTVSSDGTIKTSQVDPVFSDDFYSFSVPEDRVQGYEVGQVQASDANSDTLTYSINSGNELGYFAINSSTGAISLTSAANNKLNYEGIKNFDLGVLVLDGKGGQDAAQVSIAVTNINEAPEFNNSTPFEFEARLNAAAGEQIGNINAVDVDAGDSLTYSIINGDANGYFSIDTNGIITLTSAGVGKITGSYTLEVKAADAGGKSDQTTVIIEVGNADLGPVFDASAYTFNIAENSASNTTIGVVTAEDPENTAVISYAITSGNDAGLFEINSSTGKITLTDAGASVWNYEDGTLSYSLTISAADTALNQSTIVPVTVKITNVNEAPEFGTVAGITTNEDVVSTGTLTVTDVDAGDTLAFSTVTTPIHGTLTVNASSGAYTYTPASNYFGTDTFKIKVTDAGGLSASKSVDITINPVNDPPTTADQSFQTGQNITTPPIPFNATDVDSTNLTYNIVKQPLNGIITINSDGKFTFDPDTLFYGIDRFFYTVSDGTSISAEQIIYLSVSDAITGTDSDDRILGLSQSDAIYGGDGNDTIRGGKGVDQINGGEGDDKIVIVGDLRGGGKIDTDEDTAILGEPLTNYNGLDFNEDENGSNELIDGGNGNDTLYIYGTADVSKSNLSGIENVVIRSDVTFPGGFIQGLDSITGDGSSVIRIKADPGKTIELDFSSLGIELKDIGMIDVGENVTIVVHDLDDLGGARTLVGNGQIKAAEGVGALDLTGFTTTKDLTILNEDGSSSTGATEIGGVFIHSSGQNELTGTDNDDIIDGSDQPEVFDGKKGNDVLSGGAGDDKFIIADSGRKTILDTRGTDTIDCSKAGGAAIVDLSNGGTVGGATLVLGSGETAAGRQPIDLYLLQDLSGSFSDDVNTVRSLISGDSGLIASVRKLQSDTNFGVGSFVDKPTGGFGSSGDYVYKTQLAMARSETEFANTVNSMVVLSGADGPEAQLEALFQTALRADSEVGFRLGALRVVLLTTDAPFHKAGDFSGAIPNNGDTVLDGAGTTEDYPTIEQVREAISDSSIYPVFAVTSENVSTYNELVTQLGTGSVVTLSSDSSNIINVITTALGTVKRDFIENFTGTAFGDTLTGNSLDNVIDGGGGDDILKGLDGNDKLDGGGGNDIAVFRGKFDASSPDLSDYTITQSGSSLIVTDKIANRDAITTLTSIETIRFEGNAAGSQDVGTSIFFPKNIKTKEVSAIPSISTGTELYGADYLRALQLIDSTQSTVTIWKDTTIKYYFDKHDDTLSWTNFGGLSDKLAVSSIEKALAYYSAVTPLVFVETDNPEDATLRFNLVSHEWMTKKTGSSTVLGFMNLPDEDDTNSDWTDDPGTMALKESSKWIQGQVDFAVIVHELGHGLGLQHPHFDGGNDLYFEGVSIDENSSSSLGLFKLNQGVYTIMSYNLVHDLNPNIIAGTPATPMALDITALQALYGSDSYRNEDNTYHLTDDSSDWVCIWDTGGTDSIAYNGSKGVQIDLRSATITPETTVIDATIGGYISRVIDIPGGYTIAHGVTIEDAKGDKGNDTITGNEVANLLEGNNGSDQIQGELGNDTLYGGEGNDALYGDSGEDYLDGGADKDFLYGGIGKDTFSFWTTEDATGDTIADFELGVDKIDLSKIDALEDTFLYPSWDGEQSLYYSKDNLSGSSAGFLFFDDASHTLKGWVNMDSDPSFEIILSGVSKADLDNMTQINWLIV